MPRKVSKKELDKRRQRWKNRPLAEKIASQEKVVAEAQKNVQRALKGDLNKMTRMSNRMGDRVSQVMDEVVDDAKSILSIEKKKLMELTR